MFNPRSNHSNPTLVPPTDNLERIFHNWELCIRTKYNDKGSGPFNNDNRESIHILDQNFQSLGSESPAASLTSRTQLFSAMVNSEIESNSLICKYFHSTILKEKSRVYSKLAIQETQKAVEYTIFDLFRANTAEEQRLAKTLSIIFQFNRLRQNEGE